MGESLGSLANVKTYLIYFRVAGVQSCGHSFSKLATETLTLWAQWQAPVNHVAVYSTTKIMKAMLDSKLSISPVRTNLSDGYELPDQSILFLCTWARMTCSITEASTTLLGHLVRLSTKCVPTTRELK